MNRKLIQKSDYLLSKEKGTIFKDPGGKISICLVYPNVYHVAMSNLGYQGIYGLLNKRQDIVCERAFLPDDRDILEHMRTETPVFSIESKRAIDRFDIIAFSVSFENDYPNILRILDISKIPLYSSERNAYHPLITAGGVCLTFNPEPLSPLFDIVFIGEAEESLNEFLDIYIPLKEDKNRLNLKKKAMDIEGVYIPEFYDIEYGDDGTISERIARHGAPERIKRRYVKDFSSSVTTAIVTPEAEFSDMYLIEAMRGCPWSCRFCLVGHIYSPPRRKDMETIIADIQRAKELSLSRNIEKDGGKSTTAQAAPRIGLIGPSLTDYPHISDILCMEGVEFSITSLRASSKSAELTDLLRGYKSISIAPEAGTERLRRVINKKITEEDILLTSKHILDNGVENLRLYFMIGLPTETDQDIAGIVQLVKGVRELSDKGKVILSISAFVPKPFTPFQWHKMERPGVVKERLKFIKNGLKDVKNAKVFHDVPKYAYMQGLFSCGDRRIVKALEAMINKDDYTKACSDSGIDIDFYIFRNRDLNETLAWDFIDSGYSKEKLWKEFRIALE